VNDISAHHYRRITKAADQFESRHLRSATVDEKRLQSDRAEEGLKVANYRTTLSILGAAARQALAARIGLAPRR
jgi:hypothetical protein